MLNSTRAWANKITHLESMANQVMTKVVPDGASVFTLDESLRKSIHFELGEKTNELLNDIRSKIMGFEGSPKSEVRDLEPYKDIDLSPLIDSCKKTRLKSGYKLFGKYVGNPSYRHFELYGSYESQIVDFNSCFEIKPSIEAFWEIVYLFLELPKTDAYWHGLYGRDHIVWYNKKTALKLVKDLDSDYFTEEQYNKIKLPLGVSCTKVAEGHLLKCLASEPGCIVEKHVLIKRDSRIEVSSINVIRFSMVLY